MCSPNMQHLNILHQQHCIDLWCVRMWHCHDGWRNLERMMVEKLYERPSKVHCCKSLVSTSTAKCPPAPVVCLSADVYGGKRLGMWSLPQRAQWSCLHGAGIKVMASVTLGTNPPLNATSSSLIKSCLYVQCTFQLFHHTCLCDGCPLGMSFMLWVRFSSSCLDLIDFVLMHGNLAACSDCLALLTAADEGQLVRSSSTCSWACSCMLLLLSHGYPAQKNYKLIHIDVLSEIRLHPIWMCIW